jgi:hypothetical protein
MVTKLASITFWNTCIWTVIESISMILGPEFMKAPCGGVILFARATLLEMVLLGGLKQRS